MIKNILFTLIVSFVVVCAVLGIFVATTGFTQGENAQKTIKQEDIKEYGIPESHEWQIYTTSSTHDYLLNKKTGEVRLLIQHNETAHKLKFVED